MSLPPLTVIKTLFSPELLKKFNNKNFVFSHVVFWLCILTFINSSLFILSLWPIGCSTASYRRIQLTFQKLTPLFLEQPGLLIPEEAFGAPKLSSTCTRSHLRAQWAQARGENSRRKKLLFLPSAYDHKLRTLAETAEEGKLLLCQELTADFQIFWQ